MKKPWELTEKDIYQSTGWIKNPRLIAYTLTQPTKVHQVDKNHAYRGIGLGELNSILEGGKSGSFWSNYFDPSYYSVGLLITSNPYPKYQFKGEIPSKFRRTLNEIEAIYLNPLFFDIEWVDPVRIHPLMPFEEFKHYYPKTDKCFYNKIYKNPKISYLIDKISRSL